MDHLHQNHTECWLKCRSLGSPSALFIQMLGAGGLGICIATNATEESFRKCNLGTVAMWNTRKRNNLEFAIKGPLFPWCLLRMWHSPTPGPSASEVIWLQLRASWIMTKRCGLRGIYQYVVLLNRQWWMAVFLRLESTYLLSCRFLAKKQT